MTLVPKPLDYERGTNTKQMKVAKVIKSMVGI